MRKEEHDDISLEHFGQFEIEGIAINTTSNRKIALLQETGIRITRKYVSELANDLQGDPENSELINQLQRVTDMLFNAWDTKNHFEAFQILGDLKIPLGKLCEDFSITYTDSECLAIFQKTLIRIDDAQDNYNYGMTCSIL